MLRDGRLGREGGWSIFCDLQGVRGGPFVKPTPNRPLCSTETGIGANPWGTWLTSTGMGANFCPTSPQWAAQLHRDTWGSQYVAKFAPTGCCAPLRHVWEPAFWGGQLHLNGPHGSCAQYGSHLLVTGLTLTCSKAPRRQIWVPKFGMVHSNTSTFATKTRMGANVWPSSRQQSAGLLLRRYGSHVLAKSSQRAG